MNTIIKIPSLMIAVGLFLTACGNHEGHDHSEDGGHTHEATSEAGAIAHQPHDDEDHSEEVYLSEKQVQTLGLKLEQLSTASVGSFVEANGQLEVPPQNEAGITSMIGANVTKIHVIEGDKMKKGQKLVSLRHPDLIKMQTDYIESWNQLELQQQEFSRQETLYKEKVGSGKEFQRAKAALQILQGQVTGQEAQLQLLGLEVSQLRDGNIFQEVDLISPIDGHVRLVEVKTGQFVQPQTEMIEIVNIDHIHADLMVYEKDMHLVKEGQRVFFSVASLPDKQLEAIIYSVGKAFEQEPKAIHLHAEIENKKGLLLPGMYVKGRILVNEDEGLTLPEDAVVREEDKYYVFAGKKEQNGDENEWAFEPIEVSVGNRDGGYVRVEFIHGAPGNSLIAMNAAYYILSEWKKGDGEHSHSH